MNFSNKFDLKYYLNDKKFKKIFILTGHKSFNNSGAKNLLVKLLEKKITFYYFKKNSYPDIFELIKIINCVDNFRPDLILAVGGGSVIDYAKMANVFNININLKKIITSAKFNILKKNYKLAAIPTTAGSGAEVTSNAVIYIKRRKYSVESAALMPDDYFILPELVISAKKLIKSSSGFDAIAQSIESIISIKANNQSIIFAKKSLEMSLKKYLSFVNKPNLYNTQNMCLAANLSGKAISITKTTAPHALSYPFTSHFGISHGHAVSLTLNEFLNFNHKFMNQADTKLNLKKRFNMIFKIAKVKNILELDKYLEYLKKKARLEQNFKKLKINLDRDLNKLMTGINIQRLKNNPIPLDKNIIKKILIEVSEK